MKATHDELQQNMTDEHVFHHMPCPALPPPAHGERGTENNGKCVVN